MKEIEALVKNFVSIARERTLILAFSILILVHFNLVPAIFFTLLLPFVALHGVQMFMANKSFQAHFAEKEKFSKSLEIIDRISLGAFLAILFTLFIFVVFL